MIVIGEDMTDKPVCWGWWAECPAQIPDGLAEDGTVLYWKISCIHRDDCYKDWFGAGGRLGYFDIKLLEESK